MRNIIKVWYNSSSPLVKMLMAVSITSVLVVGHRMYYAPYIKRQRHYRAEQWAQSLLEQEEMLSQSKEQ